MTEQEVVSILEEARRVVHEDRAIQYGRPENNFARIAAVWEIILDTKITLRQVGLMLAAMKIVRDAHKPKRDNLVDLAGYAEAIDMATREQHGMQDDRDQ